MIRLLLFSIGMLFWASLFSQKYSNEFLSIGIGARAQGMGNAVVAGIDDVTSAAWNPAGLARIPRENGLQLGAMHTEWFAGVGKNDYLGVTLPLKNADRRLALSLIRFGIDGIPNTLSLYEDDGTVNFDNVKEFSAADYAFLLSYAGRKAIKTKQLYYGGNVKVIHRRIGPFATAWGFGIDLGIQYQQNNWQFGAMAKDITTTFNAWAFNFTENEKETLEITGNDIPISSVEITKPQLILGISYLFQFNKLSLRPELNTIITSDGKRNTLLSANPFSIDPAVGIEAAYKGFLFLRTGVNQFQQETDFAGASFLSVRPSLGVGLKISSLKIDYAFSDVGDNQNRFSNIISLILDVKPRKGN